MNFKIKILILSALILTGCVSTGDSGGTTPTGVLSSNSITIAEKPYTWNIGERRIISDLKYHSPEFLQEQEDKRAVAEVRQPNKNKFEKGYFVVTIYGPAISSVSNGNAKAFLVQDGNKLSERRVNGIAHKPSRGTDQWWNIVMLPLDGIDTKKTFELRVMYTFDNIYSSYEFKPDL